MEQWAKLCCAVALYQCAVVWRLQVLKCENRYLSRRIYKARNRCNNVKGDASLPATQSQRAVIMSERRYTYRGDMHSANSLACVKELNSDAARFWRNWSPLHVLWRIVAFNPK